MISSSLDLSRLALGTVQFGLDYGISNLSGKTEFEEVKRILNKAVELGINTLDTARNYGDSEEIIGNCNAKDFNIISKFPAFVHSEGELKESMRITLGNLKIHSIYGYIAHDANSLLKKPALWQTMLKLKREGIVQKIGYSLYTPEQLEKLFALNFIPQIVQVPYNFIDRRFEQYFLQLKSLGCEVHVRSVFLQGLFFLYPDKIAAFFEPLKSLLVELRKKFSSDSSIACFLMSFVLKNTCVDKLVFGVNTVAQLNENIKMLQMDKSAVEIDWHKNIPEEILMPNKWPQ